jgi:hypothetical protein
MLLFLESNYVISGANSVILRALGALLGLSADECRNTHASWGVAPG